MDVEIEHPHAHHRTGHPWLDKLLPLSALLISVVSIGIALHHGKVMQALVEQNERLVQANSIPHLQLSGSNARDDGTPEISFEVSNRGVGPAEIRSVQILVDGRPIRTPGEIFRACCDFEGTAPVTSSTLLGTMIQPGQLVRYIRLQPTKASMEVASKFDLARQQDRIVTNICYCSVFDECWTRSSEGTLRPKRVESCPMPEPQYRY